jgi:hypothetical protein
MWIAKAHETKKVYIGVKHTLTNGGECKGWSPIALPLWQLHSCKSCECSEPWLERKKKTPNWAPMTPLEIS